MKPMSFVFARLGHRQRPTVLVVTGMLISVIGLWIWGCAPNVNKENYDKIQVGMTMKEVESILGPGQEVKDRFTDDSVGSMKLPESAQWKCWQHDNMVNGAITGRRTYYIAFVDDRVVGKRHFWLG